MTRVFTTYVWVWNNGKKPINKTDIPSQSSIKIIFRDEKFTPKILDFEIIKVSRPEINFSASRISDTALSVSFDFLDQDDGVVLEVQHTGSAETELESEGVILGVPEGLKIIKTNLKKSTFVRAIVRANSLFEIKTYTRKAKYFYPFAFSVVLVVIGVYGFLVYQLNFNPTITTTTAKLREALLSEFPHATDQNISSIITKISNNSPLGNQFASVFMLAYILILIGMLVFIARRDIVTPYPKALALGDDLIKFDKEKEAG